MRRSLATISRAASILSAALLLALALGGCGSSSSGSTGAVGSIAAKTQTVISLTSSAITGTQLPAHYTCDGANEAPPLAWGTVPSSTKEVVLFALGVTPGQTNRASSSVEWSMAGLKPELGGLNAGELPAGAFLEEASDGKRQYSICPPKGQTKHYEFVIYALPTLVSVTSHINGVKLLRNLAAGPARFRAAAAGAIAVTYKRA
jgi:phosphatidylethanolamine-binding protein (PEBP) family uncharacterized protein